MLNRNETTEDDFATRAWLQKHQHEERVWIEPELRKQYELVFRMLDRDGSGSIELSELEQAAAERDLGLSVDELMAFCSTIDTDGNTELSFSEFATGMHRAGGVQDALLKIRRNRKAKKDFRPVLPFEQWIPAWQRLQLMQELERRQPELLKFTHGAQLEYRRLNEAFGREEDEDTRQEIENSDKHELVPDPSFHTLKVLWTKAQNESAVKRGARLGPQTLPDDEEGRLEEGQRLLHLRSLQSTIEQRVRAPAADANEPVTLVAKSKGDFLPFKASLVDPSYMSPVTAAGRGTRRASATLKIQTPTVT